MWTVLVTHKSQGDNLRWHGTESVFSSFNCSSFHVHGHSNAKHLKTVAMFRRASHHDKCYMNKTREYGCVCLWVCVLETRGKRIRLGLLANLESNLAGGWFKHGELERNIEFVRRKLTKLGSDKSWPDLRTVTVASRRSWSLKASGTFRWRRDDNKRLRK